MIHYRISSLLICLLVWGHTLLAQTSNPNIVIFIADDVSYNDFGCYGNEAAHTPHIDALAEEGIRFTHAYLTASSCSPSRISILSGRYPHNTGAPELHMPLPKHIPTIATQLKGSDYFVAASGKWHLGDTAKKDFDVVMDRDFGLGGEDRWKECIQQIPKGKPFFLWLASIDAHRDWGDNKYNGTTESSKLSVPEYMVDDALTRQDLANYHDEIVRFDAFIGSSIEELERRNLMDNTLVIIMADNGRPFPRNKTRLYAEGIKTPFICYWKNRIKPHQVSESLVSVIDIAPTISQLIHQEPLPSYQGVSMEEILINNPQKEVRKYVFAEHNWHDYEAYERMVATKDYTYIKNMRSWLPMSTSADNHGKPAFNALVDALEKGTISSLQEDNFISPRPVEEFYANVPDPQNIHNLASSEEKKDPLTFLRNVLREWQVQTGDTQPVSLTPDRYDFWTGQTIEEYKDRHFLDIDREEIPGAMKKASYNNEKGPY
ncbi:MAG: sulfatase [Bacteroidota bacterium]